MSEWVCSFLTAHQHKKATFRISNSHSIAKWLTSLIYLISFIQLFVILMLVGKSIIKSGFPIFHLSSIRHRHTGTLYRKKTISKAPIRRYRQYRYRRYITIVSPLIYCNENQKQVRQQDAYRQTRRVQLKLSLCTQHPVPLFKGNISVAHCMSLSTRLKGSRMMSPSNILRPPVTLTFD